MTFTGLHGRQDPHICDCLCCLLPLLGHYQYTQVLIWSVQMIEAEDWATARALAPAGAVDDAAHAMELIPPASLGPVILTEPTPTFCKVRPPHPPHPTPAVALAWCRCGSSTCLPHASFASYCDGSERLGTYYQVMLQLQPEGMAALLAAFTTVHSLPSHTLQHSLPSLMAQWVSVQKASASERCSGKLA